MSANSSFVITVLRFGIQVSPLLFAKYNVFCPIMAQQVKFTAAARKRFLEVLRETGLFCRAAEAVNMNPESIRLRRKADPELEADCQLSLECFRETLEAEIFRRGVSGTDKPVFYQGVECGSIREYSDRLLELMAKRHIPEYRDKGQVDLNVSGGVLVVPSEATTSKEWEDEHGGAAGS